MGRNTNNVDEHHQPLTLGYQDYSKLPDVKLLLSEKAQSFVKSLLILTSFYLDLTSSLKIRIVKETQHLTGLKLSQYLI